LSESISAPATAGKEKEVACCLNRSDHNLPRELGRGSGFSNFLGRNPLKGLDSQK
jgi:hypothetical protein